MRTVIRTLPGLLVLTLSLGLVSNSGCSTTSAQACQRASRIHPRPPRPSAYVLVLHHVRAVEVASALRRIGNGRNRYLVFTGVVRVTAYHHGNALLVTANPRDLAMLRGLVKQLDVPRRTVADSRSAARASR